MLLWLFNFLKSIRNFRVNSFALVKVVILLFVLCTNHSTAHSEQLLEETPLLTFTAEEKAWLQEHPEITVAHTFDWAPYSFLNSNNQPVGPSIDFFEIVAKMLGLKFKVHKDGLWNRIYEAGKNKQVDVVASMTITKEREEWFSFPRPYLVLSSYIITRKDYQGIKQRDDLKGKKLSGAKGTWQSDDVLKNYPSVTMDYVDTYSEALMEVSAGKTDATVVTLGSALYDIGQKGIFNLQLAAIYEINTDLITFGVRNDWPELASLIDKALAAIPEATKIQIINKWMPPLENQALSGPSLTEGEHAWIAENHLVRVRVPNYPPYVIPKEDGAPEGIAIDYLKLISERTGLKLNFHSSGKTFAEALDGIKNHQGPDMFALITSTPEREGDIFFSKEYLKSPYAIFTHTDETRIITGIDDILSKRIAMARKIALHEKIKKDYPNINLILFDSEIEALKAVANKKADVFIGNLTMAYYFILEEGLYTVKIAAPAPFEDQLFSIGSRNDWPELATIIEKGLASITPEERQAIRNKYFSIQYENGVSWADLLKWGGTASGIVFFTMFVFVFWNRKLKTDIIERKQAETKLLSEKQKAQNYLDVAGVMLVSLDCHGNITLINKKGCQILNIEENEALGKNWFDHYVPKNIVDEVKGVFDELIRENISSIEYHENLILTASGEERVIVFHNSVLRDELGAISGILSSGEDITDRKRAEKERKILEAQLQQSQKMESIGTLAGGIAHEFNNMLAIIMGNNELIMEELPEKSLSRESAEEIRIAGLRARDVVKQLLTFSRQDDVVKKVMDFQFVVQESMKLVRSSIPVNIKIEQNLSADSYPVMCNDTQINQILINLCNNAVDVLPEKGGIITIELLNEIIDKQHTKHRTALSPGQYVKLMVSDNGIGMDDEVLDRIFEPYFTTKDVGQGSGIGLAIVHGIVERHNGAIVVDSKPGRGTTFTIFLPAHDGLLTQETDEPNNLPVGNEYILYVDDEPSIAKLGKRHLESLGYTVESITDPDKALDMVRGDSNKFDLLITDMAMPNMTGDQLIIEVLKIRKDMPTIICTGYSAQLSEKQAAGIGVHSYIMKPINKSELATAVRKVLDSAKKSNLVKP